MSIRDNFFEPLSGDYRLSCCGKMAWLDRAARVNNSKLFCQLAPADVPIKCSSGKWPSYSLAKEMRVA
jgi:hypothetical protein